MVLELTAVALPELIEGVCDTLLPIALEKGVELDLFIAPDLPAQVWVDPVRLRQVLLNLASNAIKFSAGRDQRRGRVSIRAEMSAIERATVGENRHLQLSVADNGIGMSTSTLAQVFSPFTQGEASTTRRFGGTGLGLTICKRLVTLMQGEIEVHSTLDVGSRFSVNLPLATVPGVMAAPTPDLGGLDCLLVGPDTTLDDLGVYLAHAGAQEAQLIAQGGGQAGAETVAIDEYLGDALHFRFVVTLHERAEGFAAAAAGEHLH